MILSLLNAVFTNCSHYCDDNGNLWGTRKIPDWRRGLSAFTRYLGALEFDGYQEACYAGHYLPSSTYGSEVSNTGPI